jgi:hypothetical protein
MRNTFNTNNTYENILTGINKEEVFAEFIYKSTIVLFIIELKNAHQLSVFFIKNFFSVKLQYQAYHQFR